MKFNTMSEAKEFYFDIFLASAEIVSGNKSHPVDVWCPSRGRYMRDYVKTYHGREWFRNSFQTYRLHPAIERVIVFGLHRPIDWQQLLLEWPHRAETDPNRIAYTQNEAKGMTNKHTVTTIGKYLTRHFNMPDHEIRDIVALYVSAGDMSIRTTVEEIVDAAINGPRSCMSNTFNIRCDDGVHRHPYHVYDPSLGWSVAVRVNAGRIDGRALVYKSGDARWFVRSYKRCLEGGYSHADEMLESWLKAQGIEKASDWDGVLVKAYSVSGGYLMPYIDGGIQRADEYERGTLMITEDGDRECDSTSGMTSDTNREQCEDCGDYMDEDDSYWVGRWEDHRICCSCCDADYTRVYGRNRNQYYIHNDAAVYVGDDYYDVEYLSDNDIVELVDGEFAHIDDAVYIESCDGYYDCNDRAICYAEDTERYELVEDCWQCEHTKNWYTDNTDYVEVCGEKFHPDNAPEINEDQPTN